AETPADGELQRRRREADAQRDPAAVEESDGLASTDLVRAEDVVDRVERRRVVRVEEILLVELVAEHELLEDRRGERHEDEQDDDGEGGHGDPGAPQPGPRVRPEPRRGAARVPPRAVTTGMSALRKAWLTMTVRSRSPFACAVRMKSWLMTSSVSVRRYRE